MQCFGLSLGLMTKANPWGEYLRAISDNAAGRSIAATTGIGEATISRWLSGGTDPAPRQVVTVARAYQLNPLDALVVAGYLTEEEAQRPAAVPRALQLRAFSDLELAREAVRRIEAGGSELLESPLDGAHPAMRRGNVTALPHTVLTEDEAIELGAVAKPADEVIEIDEYDDKI